MLQNIRAVTLNVELYCTFRILMLLMIWHQGKCTKIAKHLGSYVSCRKLYATYCRYNYESVQALVIETTLQTEYKLI